MFSSENGSSSITPGRKEDTETLEQKPRVCVVVLGRGVGIHDNELRKKWESGLPDQRQEVLQELKLKEGRQISPTRLIETVVVKNPEKGILGPEEHSMFNNPTDPNNIDSRYAGANANVRAAADVVQEIINQNTKNLVGILWAAGRTPDMEIYAPEGLTQGEILAKKFIKIMGEQVMGKNIKMVFEPENVNSWDDLVGSLKWAENQQMDEVIIITVEPHIERSEDMVKEVLLQMQQEGMNVPNITWVNSESRLIKRNPRVTRLIEKARHSRAYDATVAREQNGMKQREAGTYQSQWKDVGKRIHDYDRTFLETTPEEIQSRMSKHRQLEKV